MALDEAILLTTPGPALRLHVWAAPAVTIGYFAKFTRNADDPGPPPTRRWTGGGTVEHGHDVTFSLAVPTGVSDTGTVSDRYRAIHAALADALNASGLPARLDDGAPGPTDFRAGVCFAKPVRWDVLDAASGAKIAGGAQRRSRRGWLHQGSVRVPHPDPAAEWTARFARNLTDGPVRDWEPGPETHDRAAELARTRYGAEAWLRRF